MAYYGILIAGLAAMLVPGLGWLALATYYVWMPFGALGVWILNGGRLTGLGIRLDGRAARHLAIGTASAGGVAGLIAVVLLATGWASGGELSWTARQIVIGLLVQQAIVATIEELAFRGVIQPTLASAWGHWRGLGATAILFGLFHLPNIIYQDVPPALIPTTVISLSVMGIAFGLAYHLTGGSLALPTGLHFGWNVIAFGFEDGVAPVFTGPDWITGAPEWFPESGLLGCAGLAGLSLILHRALARKKPRRSQGEPGAG
jgi:membrane protease YdiL (CAAX protease family)